VGPTIQAQIVDLKRMLQEEGMQDAIIILAMLDNAFFLARYEDGAEIGIRRAVDGQYHIDGSLGYAPREKQIIIFNQLLPLMRTFSDNDKIMLMPLPRYLWEACCKDPDHGPNILEDGHVIEQLSSIDAAFKLWRGMAFRDKIGNLKLCNSSHLISDESFWKDGPVHPSAGGYSKVVSAVIKGMDAMSAKRLSTLTEDQPLSSIKRSLDQEPGPAPDQQMQAKRPAWLTRDSNFVSRADNWRGQGGGGGGRGGCGWWGRGRRGYFPG
jgi:hypothetical protein